MKKYIILIIALVAVIAGGTVAYNALTKNAPVENAASEVSENEAQDAAVEINETDEAKETEVDAAGADESEEVFYAPDITVYDAENNAVKLSDYEGKPRILNFWASWCGPCQNEMPYFDAAYENYGDQIEFMMVDMIAGAKETKEKADALIEEKGYSFPVYYDNDQDAFYTYGVTSIPMTVFMKADGEITKAFLGVIPENTLEEYINELLG